MADSTFSPHYSEIIGIGLNKFTQSSTKKLFYEKISYKLKPNLCFKADTNKNKHLIQDKSNSNNVGIENR